MLIHSHIITQHGVALYITTLSHIITDREKIIYKYICIFSILRNVSLLASREFIVIRVGGGGGVGVQV